MEYAAILVTLLFVSFFLSIIGIIIFKYKRYVYDHFGKYPTFDEYIQQYPKLVSPGRVICYKCGGTKLQVRGLYGPTDNKKTHSCLTCGAPLYKSEH